MKKSDKRALYSLMIIFAFIIITLVFSDVDNLNNTIIPANDVTIQRK